VSVLKLLQYFKSDVILGMTSETIRLDNSISQEALLEIIDEKNKDDDTDGILVQLPVPAHMR